MPLRNIQPHAERMGEPCASSRSDRDGAGVAQALDPAELEAAFGERRADRTGEMRAALRLKIVPNEGNKPGQVYKDGSVVDMCMRCHDLPNSPDFDFQKYWPKVKHVGKD